jgi:voltage-gated potassium channel
VDFYEPSATEWERALGDLRKRLLGAFGFIILVTLIGVVGFSIIDPSAGLIRAFFMTAITLTTVGYGEEIPLETDGARVFTAVLILFGMGAVLYFVSTGTAFLLEGQLGHVFRRRRMERDLASLRDHHIVCGSGRTARYAAAELATIQRPVVLVVGDDADAARAASELPDVPVVLGDATEDDILMAAGIDRARGLIACTQSDNDNVVVTLTARQLNPSLRIVVRVQDVGHDSKVRKVGADAVVSPQHIGGLRMASELVRPTVVTFLDSMLRDRGLNLRIDEVKIGAESPVIGMALNELGLEKLPHVLLLAVRTGEHWEYNPPRSYKMEAGVVLVFMGSPEDAKVLRERLAG